MTMGSRQILFAAQESIERFLFQYQSQLAVWVLVLLAFFTGALLYRSLWMLWRRWRTNLRFRRGAQAEKQAAKFLRRRGYKIIAAQLSEPILIYVDGEPQKSMVRADFLVRRRWKTYIVEVKSGQQGTVRLPNVRRQLLEYKLVYQPDGILLLDMEHHNLQEIRFAYGAQRRKKWLRITLLILALGSLIWCFWHFF